jgi:hypothetical protein
MEWSKSDPKSHHFQKNNVSRNISQISYMSLHKQSCQVGAIFFPGYNFTKRNYRVLNIFLRHVIKGESQQEQPTFSIIFQPPPISSLIVLREREENITIRVRALTDQPISIINVNKPNQSLAQMTSLNIPDLNSFMLNKKF